MAENHNFLNLAGWENILHSLPFNHKLIHFKYGPTSTCLRSHLVQNKELISCYTYLILWLSSQLKECTMWLKIVQCARIRKIIACPIENDWIYNSNNNCVLMAIKKDYFPPKKNGSKSLNFLNIFIVFKVYKDFFICYYFVISTGWIVNGSKIFKK